MKIGMILLMTILKMVSFTGAIIVFMLSSVAFLWHQQDTTQYFLLGTVTLLLFALFLQREQRYFEARLKEEKIDFLDPNDF